MKKLGIFMMAAVFAGSIFADGIEFKLDKPSDWVANSKVKWVGAKKDIMEVTGSAMLISTKKFDIDPKKLIELEADVKMISGKPGTTYFGFRVIDKQGRYIPASAVNAVPGSETVLAKAVKPGDTVITIKANPKWKKTSIAYAVINVKKDLSDLPNYSFIGNNLTDVKQEGDNMVLTFKKGFKLAAPAGTSVRLHYEGGYMYAGGYKYIGADSGKVEFKGKVTGQLKSGMASHGWAPGTVKAEIIFLVNWGSAGSVTQISDVEMEIK